MATLANDKVTLFDLAQLPENKDMAEIINLVAQQNPMLQDIPWYPCNKGEYHETTVRTGLPSPLWTRLYQGVPSTKGTRQTVKDTTGRLQSASEVDTRLVDEHEKAEDKASVRMEEAEGHLEAMAQEVATALIYHDNATDPTKPLGLAPRFSDLTNAENKSQIIDGAGAGSDNTSIWMISWGKNTVHGIYPKNTKAGLQREDMGKEIAFDANNNKYHVYREEFKWLCGLTVRDWRYVARVANIDVSDLTIDASAGANIINLMNEMYYRHEGRRVNRGNTVIYANTTIVKYLDYQARNATKNLYLTLDQTGPNASEVLRFRGIPIKESDAILNTEEEVV